MPPLLLALRGRCAVTGKFEHADTERNLRAAAYTYEFQLTHHHALIYRSNLSVIVWPKIEVDNLPPAALYILVVLVNTNHC